MDKNIIYVIVAYTKEGVFDHQVGNPYRNKIQANDACRTYQNVCGKSTGFVYKVREYDYDKWLGEI